MWLIIISISIIYLLSSGIIYFVFYKEKQEVIQKSKEIVRDGIQFGYLELLSVKILLDEAADQAARNLINSDDPSYYQGMEQAFRESKYIINQSLAEIQKQLQDFKTETNKKE